MNDEEIAPNDVPDAIDAWIARHASKLEVRRGATTGARAVAALEEALGALHPLHRAVVTRFGFLEIRVARTYWPYQVHTDGLRILGISPEDPWCHAPEMLRLQRETQARRAAEGLGDDAELAASYPMLTTLEGLRDRWAAGPRTLTWVKWANLDDVAHLDGDLESDPRHGAGAALLARLRVLELRIDNIARAHALHAACNAITPTRFDDRGVLYLEADPEVRIRPPVRRFDGSGHGAMLRRVIDRQPTGKAFRTDAVQEKKAQALRARVKTVSVQHSGVVVHAEASLGFEVDPTALARAIGALRHVPAMWRDPALLDFDAER